MTMQRYNVGSITQMTSDMNGYIGALTNQQQSLKKDHDTVVANWQGGAVGNFQQAYQSANQAISQVIEALQGANKAAGQALDATMHVDSSVGNAIMNI